MHLLRDALPEAQGRGARIVARLAVIGIGQGLRGDDAAGIEAVRAWQQANPVTAKRADVLVELLEVPGLDLLDRLEEAEAAIIVDAVQGNGAPGTLHEVRVEQLDAFTSSAKSAHGWGVAETLRMGRQLDRGLAPADVHVIGIEGRQFDMGSGLSPEVREALPRAGVAIQRQVEESLQSMAR